MDHFRRIIVYFKPFQYYTYITRAFRSTEFRDGAHKRTNRRRLGEILGLETLIFSIFSLSVGHDYVVTTHPYIIIEKCTQLVQQQ